MQPKPDGQDKSGATGFCGWAGSDALTDENARDVGTAGIGFIGRPGGLQALLHTADGGTIRVGKTVPLADAAKTAEPRLTVAVRAISSLGQVV